MTPDSRLPTPDFLRLAVLTPPGRGAIATVAVRGSGSLAAVAHRFQPASGQELTSFPAGRIVFGRFATSPTSSEELIVGVVGPEEVEVHCHGGKPAVEAICDSLAAEGCQLVTPDCWANEHEPDPLAAEALLVLASARTERTAAILLDQYRGALRNQISEIERSLAQNNALAARTALNELLARAAVGLHLTQPWKVVIAGRPNAGKSSLMNAILGYQRSIVWHEPGTTRDVLIATTAIDGWLIELSDTAGLRTTGDPLESEGVTRAEQQIAAADLVLFVIDATTPSGAGLWPASPPATGKHLRVRNKIDLAPERLDESQLAIQTSALTGQGIETLCHAIAQALVPNSPNSAAAVPFTTLQVALLRSAADALNTGHRAAASEYLLSFPGYNYPSEQSISSDCDLP